VTYGERMNMPKEIDWGDWSADLDVRSAHATFAGRKYDDVVQEFHDNSIEMADQLRFMPIIPFQYYIFSFKHYIQSDLAKGDSDAASCYLRLIIEKIEKQPAFILPIIDKLYESIKYVATNQYIFDADKDIYGDFKDVLYRIDQLMRSVS
jgi:hypothetical protein